MNSEKIKEYIQEHQGYYLELFKDNTEFRFNLIEENPMFIEEINKGFVEIVKETIVDDVTKTLAVDAESVYNELDDINVFEFLEIE